MGCKLTLRDLSKTVISFHLHTATISRKICLMFNRVLSKQNRKQDLESHNKSGNEDSGDMSEEEEEEEVRHVNTSGPCTIK